MNDIERERGEKLASGAMKVLATIGLVAILALTAWVAVTLVCVVPNAGENLRTAVLAIETFFGGSDESLSVELDRRTLASGSTVELTVEHTGAPANQVYAFSYNCADSATFTVRAGARTEKVACNVPFKTTERVLTLVPESNMNRYLDVNLVVATEDGRLEDRSTVTIENLTIADSRSSLTADDATVATTSPQEPDLVEQRTTVPEPTRPVATKPVVTQPPVSAAPSVRQTFPRNPSVPATGPADLAVTIDATGIVTKLSGKDTFVALSTIPSDKVAAVRFTVVNRGGVASGPWGFIANLPVEGDADYRFTSPIQESLTPGMQVQYTLSFDEVLEAKNGAIKIELRPATKSDPTSNNMDALLITIKEQ